jgi:Transposase DDE domain
MNHMTPQFLDNKFLALRQVLPQQTESLAVELKAFVRQRTLRSPLELLRLVLLYCICDLTSRQIAGLLTGSRRKITDEAVRARLKGCRAWIEELINISLCQDLAWPASPTRRIIICDGSTVSAKGSRQSDYRLHLSFDALLQRACQLRVTSCRQGESLSRFCFAVGDLVLADRSFAKAPQLLEVSRQGADFLVRCSLQYLKLLDAARQPFDLIAALKSSAEASQMSLAVQACDAKTGHSLTAWIHARRLSEQQINRARRKAKRKSKCAGKTIKAATLFLCQWVLVLTSVAPSVMSSEVIFRLYGVRWQIELLIKRYKSLLDGAKLRARRDGALAEVWMWGKLLYAVLIEKLAMKRCGQEWTQMKPGRRASWWRIWDLLRQEVKELILDTEQWAGMDWQAVLSVLGERRRKRKLQSLPDEVLKWLEESLPGRAA